jgi:hypothetical protein
MHPLSETPAAVDFGRFRVLPQRRKLLAGKLPVEIGRRAFDLPLASIEAGRAVFSNGTIPERA